LHPKFLEVLDHLESVRDPARVDDSETKRWLAQAIAFAPASLQYQFGEKARELGLVPVATLHDGKGEPVITAEQIAEHLGLPVENIRREFEDLAAQAEGR
jgi:hypothetical protein